MLSQENYKILGAFWSCIYLLFFLISYLGLPFTVPRCVLTQASTRLTQAGLTDPPRKTSCLDCEGPTPCLVASLSERKWGPVTLQTDSPEHGCSHGRLLWAQMWHGDCAPVFSECLVLASKQLQRVTMSVLKS